MIYLFFKNVNDNTLESEFTLHEIESALDTTEQNDVVDLFDQEDERVETDVAETDLLNGLDTTEDNDFVELFDQVF